MKEKQKNTTFSNRKGGKQMSYILNANQKEATEITKKYNQNIKENVNLHYLEEEKRILKN